MNSNDIYKETTERVVKLSGGILSLAFISKEERAKNFKRALFDYTCEKLLETDENQVIVEEIGLVFEKIDSQFTSEEEKDAFYTNYIHCILAQYSVLTENPYIWEETPSVEPDEYPRFENDKFITPSTKSKEEIAIWLFREFDKKLKPTKAKQKKRK